MKEIFDTLKCAVESLAPAITIQNQTSDRTPSFGQNQKHCESAPHHGLLCKPHCPAMNVRQAIEAKY